MKDFMKSSTEVLLMLRISHSLLTNHASYVKFVTAIVEATKKLIHTSLLQLAHPDPWLRSSVLRKIGHYYTGNWHRNKIETDYCSWNKFLSDRFLLFLLCQISFLVCKLSKYFNTIVNIWISYVIYELLIPIFVLLEVILTYIMTPFPTFESLINDLMIYLMSYFWKIVCVIFSVTVKTSTLF